MKKTTRSTPKKFNFWVWLDKRSVIHRFMLLACFWLTIDTGLWCRFFVLADTRFNGMEIAAIISAVTAPLMALQGWVFKIYSDRKNTLTESDFYQEENFSRRRRGGRRQPSEENDNYDGP